MPDTDIAISDFATCEFAYEVPDNYTLHMSCEFAIMPQAIT